jgi:prepilin-type N-terminal cleavage/methylation domain-containing protein
MKKAFTLIELLVVIAIIALLLSIIVPAMRLAKMKASSVVCLTNTKNMSLAWYSYQSDNNGRIMSAQMDGFEPGGTYVGWIGRPRTATGTPVLQIDQTAAITDQDAIRGIRQGRLHEYLDSPESYKCPGDTLRKSVYSGINPYVSYSMPTCLYAETNPSGSGYNMQIKKFSEITSPSMRYVFVEVAQERNWNASGWFSFGAPEWYGRANGHNVVGGWGWWDPMAINHGDSSIIGYADGHSEARRWQDPFTRERVSKLSGQAVSLYNVEFPPAGQTEDIQYMARGWAYRYRQ